MNPDEWEKRLLAATAKVQAKVAVLASNEGRNRSVGVGASGDKTILADKAAEDILLRSILGAGSIRVLSEEAGAVGEEGAELLAVIDPLDGSSNFESGIPFYCTSVAIVEGPSTEVTFGLVRDLVSGDVYLARKGIGATKNGKPIRTSKATDLSTAVVGVDLSRSPTSQLNSLARLISGAKRVVHLGANALEVCYLAEGRTDAFVDLRGRIRVTDFAAAWLIAREAGASITGPAGEDIEVEFDLQHRLSFVASANRDLHSRLLELLHSSKGRA